MLLVCELHVHTDCILFACSDCRQCHQDGHQDHVSADASAAESGHVFYGVKTWARGGGGVFTYLLHAANYQRTSVVCWQAEETCGFRMCHRWQDELKLLTLCWKWKVCAMYTTSWLKRKETNKHLIWKVALQKLAWSFFSICWAIGYIASLASFIMFLRLPAACLRQDFLASHCKIHA